MSSSGQAAGGAAQLTTRSSPHPRGLALPIRASAPPPLHELDEDTFEQLCRDVFAAEPNIATCSRYGIRGQRQFGIDLLADVRNSANHEVAQCKCYAEFPKRKIADASDEFLNHLAYWQEKRVVRFVLIVAEPLEKTGQQDQVIVERRRFAAVGIRYEVWSLHTLVTRLRPWPSIVEQYIDQGRGHWVERICGPAPFRVDAEPARATGPAIPGPSTEPQFAALLAMASEGFSAKLESCRALARKGLNSAAEAALAELLSDSAFSDILPANTRAKAIRLQASLALDRSGGLETAKVLLARADRLDGTVSIRWQAQIVLDEQGPDACIAFLASNGDGGEDVTNLLGVCHLRAGRTQEAIDLLEPLLGDATSADAERLLALALAAAGRSDEACRRACSALAREPESWATRVAIGIVLYTGALSPLASHGRIAGWPEPCDWNLVRRDDASVARLREAAEIFGSLCTDRQERIDRETLQAWRLACLANDAERQSDAETYCRDVLKESPTNAAAIAWALARAFPTEGTRRVIDPLVASRALENLLASGRGDILHLSVLASLLSWRGKSSKIAATLRRYQPLFAEGAAAESFAALQAEATLRSNGVIADAAWIDQDRVALLGAMRETEPGAARDALVGVAHRIQNVGGTDAVFVDALFRLAALGFIRDVAPFADRVVEVAGTADAVRLAAHAKAADSDYAGAVRLLDARISDFPGSALPRNLRLLRAQCNEQLGRLPEAISEMQALRETGAGLAEVLGLADMYVRRGDLALAAQTISGVADDPDVTPELALRFAQVLGSDDPTLATKLWRRAVKQELDPRLLPVAFSIARRLAIGPESAPIVQRMLASAVPREGATEEATVVAMSIDQVREFLQARRAEMERFSRLHEVGTVPLHLLAPQMGWSLPRLFHEMPLRRERTGMAAGLLLAEHGGRAIAERFPDDPGTWRLHLDVTSVLLAHHIGLLDAVERCFRPLRVPSHLVPALLAMRGDLLDGNPLEVDAAREIVGAAAANRIGLISVGQDTGESGRLGLLLERAAEMSGMVLTWDNDARSASANGKPAINISGVVAGLEGFGEITSTEADEARARLGVAGTEAPVGGVVAKGSALLCHANTIQELSQAGLLEAACRALHINAEDDFIAGLRARLLDDEARTETARWLDDLRERLNRGIQDGTYELLPIVPVLEEELGPRDGPIACLLDLLRIPAAEGSVVWIDDRALNAHAACGSAPLLGVADILAALRKYGRLTEEDCYARLLRLRAGNVAFIPAWEGELAFWLRRAPVADGRVIETDQLAVLRRYLACCLSHERVLQIPPVPDGAPNLGGEVGFVISWQRAVATTLTSLWSDPALAPAQIVGCSRWLRDNIAVDRYERLPVYQPTAEGRIAVLVSGLSTLLCGGFLLQRPFSAGDDRCGEYMAWLDAEVVGPRLRADPALEQALVTALGNFLAERPQPEEEEAAKVRRVLTAQFLNVLPAGLRSKLMGDRRLLADLGFDQDLRVVEIGRLTLPAKTYLDAVAAALGGSAVQITDASGEALTIDASLADGQVVATITTQGAVMAVTDPVNNLLAADVDARRLLSAKGPWLDAPASARISHLEDLLALADRSERVLAAIDLRSETAAAFYDALRSHLGQGEGISFRHLEPPSIQSLIRFLRLPAGGLFSQRMATAAVDLIADYGIDEAFLRLGSLPSPLPPPVVDAFAEMSGSEQLDSLGRWAEAFPTPVHRIHLARLAGHLETVADKDSVRGKQVSALVASATDDSLSTFASLVRAFGGRSAQWNGAREVGPAERIAAGWVHACQLFRVIAPVVDAADFRDLADSHSGESISAIFADEAAYRSDVACPQFVTPGALLTWGTAHAMAAPGVSLTQVEREVLRDLVVQNVDAVPFPQGWLLDAKFLRPNATASFLGDPIDGFVNSVTETDIGKWYSVEAQREVLLHSLQAAGPEKSGLDAWRMVLCLASFASIPADMEENLAEAVERTVNVAPSDDPSLCREILRFTARQAGHSGHARSREETTRLFSQITSALIGAAGDHFADERCVEHVLRAAVDLSREGPGTVSIMAFAGLVGRVSEAGPVAIKTARRVLTQAARNIPFAQAESLWPLIVELRSR
jgi:tetratricopeptide (TPR) repeat protein